LLIKSSSKQIHNITYASERQGEKSKKIFFRKRIGERLLYTFNYLKLLIKIIFWRLSHPSHDHSRPRMDAPQPEIFFALRLAIGYHKRIVAPVAGGMLNFAGRTPALTPILLFKGGGGDEPGPSGRASDA
jgi:hypothetical protein